MLRRLIRKFIFFLIKPFILLYLNSERRYRYKDIDLIIKPGVFHPGLFFSTKFLLNYIKNFDLRGKNILELGAGSGLISIYLSKKGSKVLASDISENAIKNIKENSIRNNSKIGIIKSNIFSNIDQQFFDFIIINPPYFDKNPVTDKQYAWYCGADHEYFKMLFSQLRNYIDKNSKVIMILSEVSKVNSILEIAKKREIKMELVFQKRVFFEEQFIFEIIPDKNKPEI